MLFNKFISYSIYSIFKNFQNKLNNYPLNLFQFSGTFIPINFKYIFDLKFFIVVYNIIFILYCINHASYIIMLEYY